MPKKPAGWVRLDNAAIIFPPTSDKQDPKVFRFSCALHEPIKPAALQIALDETVTVFKGFLNVLKHGFFWYYLESTDIRPLVHEDNRPICSPLYDRNAHTLLFDVSYYKNRINFEVFHALTDGTGALCFLKTLVGNYLIHVHPHLKDAKALVTDGGSSVHEKMADSFQKYYDPKKRKRLRPVSSYKIRKTKLSENRIKMIEGIMPVDQTLALAKKANTTLTVYLAAILICSIYDSMSLRDRKKPITLSVPVNLRNFFSSESVRNFFGVTYVSYHVKQEGPVFEDIVKSIAAQFKDNLTPEKMVANFGAMVSMEKNIAIRAIPLALKEFGLRIAYTSNENAVTAALSNLSRVQIADVFHPYIDYFDVMASTKKLQICICSFENNLVINFTDRFISADIQKCFFRNLAEKGIPIKIVSNPID